MFEVALYFSSINFITCFFFPFAQTLMNVRSVMVAAAIIVTISLDHFIVAVRKEPVWVLTIWLVLVRNAKLSFSAYDHWRKILLLLRMEINNDHQGKTTDRSFKCIISVYFFGESMIFLSNATAGLTKLLAALISLRTLFRSRTLFCYPFCPKDTRVRSIGRKVEKYCGCVVIFCDSTISKLLWIKHE